MKKVWNEIVHDLPDPHLLQSWQWGEIKTEFGWRPHPLVWGQKGSGFEVYPGGEAHRLEGEPFAAALVLERSLPFGLSALYVPKGPLLEDWSDKKLRSAVIQDLMSFARQAGAVFVKIDPDVLLGKGVPGKRDAQECEPGKEVQDMLEDRDWVFSSDQIQYRNTVLVDLTEPEDEILMRMKSKTRYNIRLAEKKGVTVRRGSRRDMELLYSMYAKTSVRGGFTIRGQTYYETVWDQFFPSEEKDEYDPVAVPLIAEVEGDPVAAAVMFRFGERAWYLHGMSTTKHREKMGTYLVQWEGMRWAKEQGCTVYDMWGAPDRFEKDDPMWGVYRFKRGFGGEVVRTLGAWDYPEKPLYYKAYIKLLPKLLSVMREIGDRQTEEAAAG